ncbi:MULTISPECIES: CDP-alcohol phosphatidyltransferase family protein [Mycolicibacterium]|uniref:CDP-alcohol phosphatidyltransferase family protein n=1 Tax=Mycolicibacterium TaxID=1866885 RepID=UPI001CDBBC9C|nr:CDP-alcohol phosphatidyltransferase family protein [Mycolicibacterium fortuitum]UBV20386.1 CDP-alcohol phosphatidyltransferase family protein [Mycolicibacterium fortuitum]
MQGLYALKPWYTRRLGGIVAAAVVRGISPDAFTVVGVLGAIGAALATVWGWWPVVAALLAVRLAGANLDGAVARARGVSRPWGFVLNELGDRASDLVMFAGLALLAARMGGPVIWVLVAALAATLPTFVSLAGVGASAARRNGGPFGKTERCLAVVVAAAIPAVIGWVCAVVVVGSVLTALTRLVGVRRELVA